MYLHIYFSKISIPQSKKAQLAELPSYWTDFKTVGFFLPSEAITKKINYVLGTVKFISLNHCGECLTATIKKMNKFMSAQHCKGQ